MASGSTLGSAIGTSRVATDLVQSVEPGSGTISTARPSCLNQPSFVATAKAAPTPVVIVRAQVATRSGVSAAAARERQSPSVSRSEAIRIIERNLPGSSGILPPAKGEPDGLPDQPHSPQG